MTLQIVAEDESWADVPRVKLTIQATNVAPLAVPTGSALTVARTHPDGSRYSVILDDPDLRISGTQVVFDYHCPFNQEITYTAQAGAAQSAPSAVTVLSSDATWLIHSTNPELSLPVDHVSKFNGRARAGRSGTFKVWGSAAPVTRSGGVRDSVETGVTVAVDYTLTDRMWLLLDDSTPFLLNTVADDDWPAKWEWAQCGAAQEQEPGVKARRPYPLRFFVLPYTVVAQPDLDLTALWSCGDVELAYATCGAVEAAYVTCLGLQTNTPGT